jgi:hypothetical protein
VTLGGEGRPGAGAGQSRLGAREGWPGGTPEWAASASWPALSEWAGRLAQAALSSIDREYPVALAHVMSGPEESVSQARLHPAFYGSFDWHSAVEMHWVLVRLLRLCPEAIPVEEARQALDRHLTPDALAVEAAYLENHPSFERPYGWGWALMLAHDANLLASSAGESVGPSGLGRSVGRSATTWASALSPLAEVVAGHLTGWLARAKLPVRHGVHSNSAFGLRLALPFAEARRADGGAQAGLVEAIAGAATAWYGRDAAYPAGWEPSASDFLSPALVEAELMANLVAPDEYPQWLARFLPGLDEGEPSGLFEPVQLFDPEDGHHAHLAGLNLCRAWAWRRLASVLPPGDPRVARAGEAARRHLMASLPLVTGAGYMIEHWLAAYALLAASASSPAHAVLGPNTCRRKVPKQ